jgi:hypothetical protein
VEQGPDRRRHLAHRKRYSIAPLRAYTLQAAIAAFTPRVPPRHPRTGARLRCSTTGCFGFSHLRLSNLTAQWPLPSAKARSRVFVLSMTLLAREHLSHYQWAPKHAGPARISTDSPGTLWTLTNVERSPSTLRTPAAMSRPFC